MPRALWLPDVLRDAGLVVRPLAGWEKRGGEGFDPKGVIWHHTVTTAAQSDAGRDHWMAVVGRPEAGAPPPLCNYSTNRDGSVSIIAAGIANHGGKGEWQGLKGNKWWLGDEMKNEGKAVLEKWVPGQLESARIAAAACLNHIGADPIMFTFHKEYGNRPPGWPGRKTDPHTLKIATERANVAAIMEELMATFRDVPDNHPFNAGVEWLAAQGITSGIKKDDPSTALDEDMFGPDLPVTRGQFATMLKRYHDKLGN